MTHFKNLLFIICIILLISCGKNKQSTIVVAVSNDVQTFNPLFSSNALEANINELLFLPLVQHNWDSLRGELTNEPILAEKIEWSLDSSSVKVILRGGLKWSDGQPITVDDIIFSFDVYSDPEVKSYLFGMFSNYDTDSSNHINLKACFEKLSENSVNINFKTKSRASYIDIDFPIIPKHIFSKYKRSELRSAVENLNPVVSGSYKIEKYESNQSITLVKNPLCYLINEKSVNKIVFKIIPDYNSQLLMLKKGEVDIAEDVRIEDLSILKDNSDLRILTIKGREYDFIGWNNIDPIKYNSSGKIAPNFFFGSSAVRKALTLSIDRSAIVREYLKDHAELANSSISYIFTSAINNKLEPIKQDVVQAKDLLKSDSWVDTNNDGILEKEGVPFEFTLSIASGNPRRDYAATILQNDLKAIGIKMNIEHMELNAFLDKLMSHQLTAWIASQQIAIPLDLRSSWYSDFQQAPLNFAGFQNNSMDIIIEKYDASKTKVEKDKLSIDAEKILYDQQPFTFLFWVDNISVINKRVRNISLSPLGLIRNCWMWQVD